MKTIIRHKTFAILIEANDTSNFQMGGGKMFPMNSGAIVFPVEDFSFNFWFG